MNVKQSPGIGKGTPGPGRKKGVPNKATTALKDMILAALNDAGGVAYLVAQARDNPTAFLTLVGKVLPLQVKADVTTREELPDVSHLTDEQLRVLASIKR